VADRPQREPDKRTLTLLIVPIIAFTVISTIGDALATTLVDTHPLWLISMNARNRNLILATNQLDAWSYYSVATIRLLLSDPVYFLLGYWYGDTALKWIEKRTKTIGEGFRMWEGWFRRASYLFVFAAPNPYVCVFAGAASMSVGGFFAANILGTVARLYLIRRLGESFEAPIDDVLDFIKDYRIPLLIISVLLVGLMALLELRKGNGEIDALLHLEDDLLGASDEEDEDDPPLDGPAADAPEVDDPDDQPADTEARP
jgi:membrane protein DedA with SNARE-associated domain